MKRERQKNPENLDKQQIRKVMNVGYVVFKNLFAAHHGRIGIHMHQKINAERHNAGYLVQFTKQKRPADFDCHFSSLKRISGFWILDS
jgi:hypothetical protein